MINLEGKNILITGASGGIGSSIAKKLHELGATITISGTREEKLKELSSELGDKNVHILTCDLSDSDSVEKLAKDAEEKMSSIDILINNAGITKDSLAMRMSKEDWLNVLNVNLTSVFTLSKACMRGMMKKRYGRIINISSVVGTSGNPGQANYVAAKAGLDGLTKTLAIELASRNITVNSIAPGFISTAMTDKLTDEQKDKISANIPAKRFGQPEDISNLVAYIASDESSYITGQTIHVNGGMFMA